MSRRSILPVLVLLGGGILVPPAEAQVPLPFAVQVGGGWSAAVGDFSDIANEGWGFSLGAGLPLTGNLGVSLGYSQARFDSDVYAGDVVDSGWSVNLSYLLPVGPLPVLPWVGGGVALHRLDLRGEAAQPERGNPGIGVAGGFLIPLTSSVGLSPSIGYLGYSSEMPNLERLWVSHMSLGVALNLTPR